MYVAAESAVVLHIHIFFLYFRIPVLSQFYYSISIRHSIHGINLRLQ